MDTDLNPLGVFINLIKIGVDSCYITAYIYQSDKIYKDHHVGLPIKSLGEASVSFHGNG